MYAFNYQKPDSPRKAANAIGKADDGKFLAGGQTLLPTMKQRLASPSTIVDLGRIDAMRGIEVKARNVVIGALDTPRRCQHIGRNTGENSCAG